jgi:NADH dehydrogenase
MNAHMTDAPIEQRTIAILGAGYGGLSAARKLGELFLLEPRLQEHYRIVLVDRHPYQLYTPTLYEIATTSATLAKNIELERIITFPISEAIRGLPVEFIEATAETIDLKTRTIRLQGRDPLSWEYLIIACGTETNFYGIPGLEAHSLPLKTFIDAVRIRDAVEAAFSDPVQKPIRVLVGGGGSTGVEFSAELINWTRHLEKRYKKRGVCRIILLEAGPEILASIDPNAMERARIRLEDLGVVIRTDAAIKKVEKNEVELDTGERIPFDILVWTGGVKAGKLVAELETKLDPKGRAEVEETLACIPTDPHLDVAKRVFAIGDAACFNDPKTGRPVPGVARAAIEQGVIAAFNVVADIRNHPKRQFRPRTYPYIVPVGGKWAVVKIGPLLISGLAGWIVKGLVELRYLTSVLPIRFALKTWLKGLWIFIRND